MSNHLKRAIRLSKKTGDRIIVFDNAGEDAYVIVPFQDYERLATKGRGVKGLTEGELIDKINRDIAVWKNEQEEDGIEPWEKEKEDLLQPGDWEGISDDDDMDNDPEPEEDEPFDDYLPDWEDGGDDEDEEPGDETFDKKPKKSGWNIPGSRKENAEEVIEEDRQYLEEV